MYRKHQDLVFFNFHLLINFSVQILSFIIYYLLIYLYNLLKAGLIMLLRLTWIICTWSRNFLLLFILDIMFFWHWKSLCLGIFKSSICIIGTRSWHFNSCIKFRSFSFTKSKFRRSRWSFTNILSWSWCFIYIIECISLSLWKLWCRHTNDCGFLFICTGSRYFNRFLICRRLWPETKHRSIFHKRI